MDTGIRILLIDDDKDDQDFFCEAVMVIHPDGLCKLASTGNQALDILSSSPLFDVIFLDLRLPIMDGFELLPLIRLIDHYANVPIYAITTSVSKIEISRLKSLGITDVLTKPSSFLELTASLEGPLQSCYMPC